MDNVTQMRKPEQLRVYTPEKDRDFGSLILVFNIRGEPGDDNYIEVLASMGPGYDYAVEGDPDGAHDQIREVCSDKPDGAFVVTAKWSGSGEDVDWDATGVRRLAVEERRQISDNHDLQALVSYWAATHWGDVPCEVCKKLPGEHEPYVLRCPKEE